MRPRYANRCLCAWCAGAIAWASLAVDRVAVAGNRPVGDWVSGCRDVFETVFREEAVDSVEPPSLRLPQLSIHGIGSDDALDRTASEILAGVFKEYCLPVASAGARSASQEAEADLMLLLGGDLAAAREILRRSSGDLELSVTLHADCADDELVYGLTTSFASGQATVTIIRLSDGAILHQASSWAQARRSSRDDAVLEAISQATESASRDAAIEVIRIAVRNSSDTVLIPLDAMGRRCSSPGSIAASIARLVSPDRRVEVLSPAHSIRVSPRMTEAQLVAVVQAVGAEVGPATFDGVFVLFPGENWLERPMLWVALAAGLAFVVGMIRRSRPL